jgi:dTDP-4-amino-4,6-dideoxygalactose transaminase
MTADMRVPGKDYERQYAGLMDELLPEIERVLRTEEPVLGASLEQFEQEAAARFGTAHAVGVNSGTDALVLSLRALGIGRGDEVVTTAHTFLATIGAIVTVGARPVLVDPDPQTMNLRAEAVLPVLSSRTRAVLPVHLYGLLCPMTDLVDLCRQRDLRLIEDAAQAHGACDAAGRPAGSFGTAGCFSFHPSKNLGAFGDGGLVTTDDAELAARLRVLRNLGKVSKHEIRHIAANSKLDTLQAAILRVKLRRLEGWNARRRELAAIYARLLAGAGDLRLPADPGHGQHVFHLYVVRTAFRGELAAHLERAGVHAGMHYPIPPHLQELDVDLGYRRGDFPVAESIAATCLSLPIAPELTDGEIGYVADRIRGFFDD